jgi:hypothetical protein
MIHFVSVELGMNEIASDVGHPMGEKRCDEYVLVAGCARVNGGEMSTHHGDHLQGAQASPGAGPPSC